MNAPRIDAILLRSSDPEALADFYRRAFDLGEPRWTGADHLGFAVANTYLGFDRSTDEAGRGATSVWFKVEDVPAVHARLLELGARTRKAPDSECSPGETLAEVLDPDGNAIGLVGPA